MVELVELVEIVEIVEMVEKVIMVEMIEMARWRVGGGRGSKNSKLEISDAISCEYLYTA